MQEQQITSAWMMANWQRAKRMPNLRTIINKIKNRGRSKPKKDQEQNQADFDKMVEEMTGDLNIKSQE